MPILRRRRPRARAASVQASRTGSGRERPSLQSPRRARSTPRGCRRRLMGTRAVWQAVSGLCLAGSYLSDGCTCLQSPAARGGGGAPPDSGCSPHRVLIYICFFQIRFQTSARRLIRSDLSDGIGRIQIRPHILGPDRCIERPDAFARLARSSGEPLPLLPISALKHIPSEPESEGAHPKSDSVSELPAAQGGCSYSQVPGYLRVKVVTRESRNCRVLRFAHAKEHTSIFL